MSFISPYAVGSGIPEIKSILSGIDLSRVLGLRTLVAKLIGMIGAVGAGLVVGRTGESIVSKIVNGLWIIC